MLTYEHHFKFGKLVLLLRMTCIFRIFIIIVIKLSFITHLNTTGPRRVFVWPAVSNKKSDYFKPRHIVYSGAVWISQKLHMKSTDDHLQPDISKLIDEMQKQPYM